MPQALILWHALHAQKNKEFEREERDDSQKLAILLSRPDIYNEMFGKDAKSEVENINFVETEDEEGRVMSTMTPDEFRAAIQNQEYATKDRVLVKQGPSLFDSEEDEKYAEYTDSDDDDELIVERY